MIAKFANCVGSLASALGLAAPSAESAAPARNAVARTELERLFPELLGKTRHPKEA